MNNKGFSLVELLIVILILAVITGIAIPAYSLITARANEASTEAEMTNIAKSLEIYNSDNQAYPISGEYPDILIDNDYLNDFSNLDAWETAYSYTSDGTSYILNSSGMDKISGNSDDITISDGVLTSDGVYNN
jgi:prepilin-type N-terminal cleavage/methylation domain-containing protein